MGDGSKHDSAASYRNSQGVPEHAPVAGRRRPREVTADPVFPVSAADELPFRIASGEEGHKLESCRARQLGLPF